MEFSDSCSGSSDSRTTSTFSDSVKQIIRNSYQFIFFLASNINRGHIFLFYIMDRFLSLKPRVPQIRIRYSQYSGC